MAKKVVKKTPKAKPAAASTAAVEDIPHKPQALICHRCGAEIPPDTDREHSGAGVTHHIGVCFEIVKAQRDEFREKFTRISATPAPAEKAAKKK